MDDSRTLFVGNLGPEITEALLRELFLQAGPIEKVRLARFNGVPKPFAHIVFHHECSVTYAKNIFKGTKLHKRELLLQQNNASRDSGQNYFTPHLNNLRDARAELPLYGNQFLDARNDDLPRGNYYRDERRTPPTRGNDFRSRRNEDRYQDNRNTPPRHDYFQDRSPLMDNHYRGDRSSPPVHGNQFRERSPSRGSRYHGERNESPSWSDQYRGDTPPHGRDRSRGNQYREDRNGRQHRDRHERSPYGNSRHDERNERSRHGHNHRDDRNNRSSRRHHRR